MERSLRDSLFLPNISSVTNMQLRTVDFFFGFWRWNFYRRCDMLPSPKIQLRKFYYSSDVNSEDCHSEFHHRSSKTYASAPSGSNSNEIQRDRPPLNTRPNSGKICLRFLAQGAGHEMSADWPAAGPRGRKNPEPGQRIVLSLCLLQLELFSKSSSPTLFSCFPLLLRPTLLLLPRWYFFFPCRTSSQGLS